MAQNRPARPVKGVCDCGAPVKWFGNVTVSENVFTATRQAALCPECGVWQKEQVCFDVTSWVETTDPRIIKKEVADEIADRD